MEALPPDRGFLGVLTAGRACDSLGSQAEPGNQWVVISEKCRKGTEVKIPDPFGESNVEELEGLSVVRLSRLIEMKLASGMGSLRRTNKDFADVVELIAIRKIDSSFARLLHSSLRSTFRELVHRVTSED